MAKRKLSTDEKERIAEERRSREISAHPEKMISIRVEDETDENGDPIIWVHYVGERPSKDWQRGSSQ